MSLFGGRNSWRARRASHSVHPVHGARGLRLWWWWIIRRMRSRRHDIRRRHRGRRRDRIRGRSNRWMLRRRFLVFRTSMQCSTVEFRLSKSTSAIRTEQRGAHGCHFNLHYFLRVGLVVKAVAQDIAKVSQRAFDRICDSFFFTLSSV